MIEPWTNEKRTARGHYKVFRVWEEENRSPKTGEVHPFYVIDSVNWVNVIPVTPEGQLVFVRQWRHGTRHVTLEVPGGMVDEGETPAEAAARELREESGFAADRIIDLGYVEPNPAIQRNRCHTFLAQGARQVEEPQPEGTEDLETVFIDPSAVPGLILCQEITHALVVTAFYLYDAWRREEGIL